VITSLLVLLGAGAGVQANAAPAPKITAPATSTNGCVVVPALEVAVCLSRF
jgi:hypothetical protein